MKDAKPDEFRALIRFPRSLIEQIDRLRHDEQGQVVESRNSAIIRAVREHVEGRAEELRRKQQASQRTGAGSEAAKSASRPAIPIAAAKGRKDRKT